MKLRRVVVVVALAFLAAPLAAEAQTARAPRIGIVEAGSQSANQHFVEAFRAGLRELGYVEGQNIAVEERWAEGRVERFRGERWPMARRSGVEAEG
jgi:putative tryptophan/tyrosine transport system substrate-binding protein